MKTPKPSLKKKYPYVAIPLILVAIVAVVLYVILTSNKTQDNPTTTNTTSDSSLNDTNKTTTTTSEGLPTNSTTTTSDQVPTSDSLSVTIDSFTQINGVVNAIASTSNNGTCVFTYKPADGGKPVTRQISITDKTCTSSISENEFTYIGDWSLTVTYYNNSQKIEVQKNVTIS